MKTRDWQICCDICRKSVMGVAIVETDRETGYIDRLCVRCAEGRANYNGLGVTPLEN